MVQCLAVTTAPRLAWCGAIGGAMRARRCQFPRRPEPFALGALLQYSAPCVSCPCFPRPAASAQPQSDPLRAPGLPVRQPSGLQALRRPCPAEPRRPGRAMPPRRRRAPAGAAAARAAPAPAAAAQAGIEDLPDSVLSTIFTLAGPLKEVG